MKRLIAAFAQNTVFATFFWVFLLILGGLAVLRMPKETFPEFSLERITITIPFPGAGPEAVEEGVCRKVEKALEGMVGIKEVTTFSAENLCTADVEVMEGHDLALLLDRVRTRVNAVTTFPAGAQKPIISDVLLRNPLVLLSLSGGMSERRLKEWAREVEYELEQFPNLSQVEIFGIRDYEISVEVSAERLREYGLSFDAVTDAVRRNSVNLEGGTIRTRNEEIRVRTVGRRQTASDLGSIVVLARPQGEIITLDRLADIHDGFTDDPVFASVNGEPAILMSVYKTRQEDALAISTAVRDFVHQKQQQLPSGLNIKLLYDNTGQLKSRIDLLLDNGIYGVWLVFLVLWLYMGMRLSFWVVLGSLCPMIGAVAATWGLGGSINMISLLALIVVSGILVDDGIVLSEAIYVRRQQGAGPLQAVMEGVSEVGSPVFAAVAVNILGYIPLFFVGGLMGKVIAILPTITIIAMIISLVETYLILPAHLKHIPAASPATEKANVLQRTQRSLHRWANRWLDWMTVKVFAPLAEKSVSNRYLTLCIFASLLLLTLGLLQSGVFKFEFLPEIDGHIVEARVEFPNGTPAEVTRRALKQVDQAIVNLANRTPTKSGEPLIVDRVAAIGQSLGDVQEAGPHYGSMQVILLESEKRGIHTKDIMAAWEREIGPIPGIKSITFEGMGVLTGVPIEVWLQGNDMNRLLAAADDLMTRLHQFDGVFQIHSDFRPGKNEIQLELKPEAQALGLNASDLAAQVHAAYYGEEAIRMQRGREDIQVKVRYTADERSRISDLDRMHIRTRSGQVVPLLSVANVSFVPGYATIVRTNGMRRIAVKAAVDTNIANPNEVMAELSHGFFDELGARHPGVFFTLQGEHKNLLESFSSLQVAYPLAIIAIYVVIATVFRSYAQPLVIMMTIPFGFIGCVLGHLVLGYDISIMSLLGMVALSGVMVNDSIVLVERINSNLAQGLLFSKAIREAVVRRLRPIFLTAITAVSGVTPLIFETDFQARMIVPMAISIAAGLLFSTLVDMFTIPAILTVLNDIRCALHRVRHGVWPEREAVEPARNRTPLEAVKGTTILTPQS
jgi:multidrug efflux pump subunit AcrB